MDLESVLTEVGTWPVEDRLRLMEQVWDGLNEQQYEPELTDELKSKLDRRLDALEANPDDVVTWDEIRKFARRPR